MVTLFPTEAYLDPHDLKSLQIFPNFCFNHYSAAIFQMETSNFIRHAFIRLFSILLWKKLCFLIGDGGLKGIWPGYRSCHRVSSAVATQSGCIRASTYDSPSTKHTMFQETTHQAGHARATEQFANTQEAEICWLQTHKTPESHRRGDS